MAVFDEVCYSLSPSLSPTRRNELAAILDINGAASHPPYTHLVAPPASHAHNNATADPTIKFVTDCWVDRSIIMGKCQPEQYYSPDPAMIFSGVVACATDLSVADLEVLSAGITALGGQWRAGLTRDVTHLFALRTGSDKYKTALHFAPQTHMCIVTPHWFDDAVRLGRRVPEMPYTWPDPSVLRPGVALDLDEGGLTPEGRRRKTTTTDTAGDAENFSGGEHIIRVWDGRRILLSTSLELTLGSRRAIEARIQRAGGVIVPISDDANDDMEEKAVDKSDVLVTRWRYGKSYFKAARASLLIGTLSWLFSVESSGTLHSPFDSLLWYPTPRGGIPDLANCEISITNYTGAARDYLKRLLTLVGAKFTPSMSQTTKVLIAGFQPSPKTTRALSWSIPVVNHTWLEDCFVEWRSLTVGLERYIVFSPGVDFGKMLTTRQDGLLSSQSVPQRLSGGAVPGGRGVGTIDLKQEEMRCVEYRARARIDEGGRDLSMSRRASAAHLEDDSRTELRGRPRSRAGSVKKTPSSAPRVQRASMSTMSALGAFVDHVIELPTDDDMDRQTRTPTKQRARRNSVSTAGLFSSPNEVEVVVKSSKDGKGKGKEQKSGVNGMGQQQAGKEDEDDPQSPHPPRPKPRLVQRKPDMQTEGAAKTVPAQTSGSSPPRNTRPLTTNTGLPHPDAGEESEASVPPRRGAGVGSATPVRSSMKPRARSKSQSRPGSVMGGDSGDEAKVVTAESGIATKAGRGREVERATRQSGAVPKKEPTIKEGKAKAPPRPRPRSPSRSSSPISSPAKTPHRSKQRPSVVVPSVPEYFSSQSMREDRAGGQETGKNGADGGAISGGQRKRLAPVAPAEGSTSTNKRAKPSPLSVTHSGKSKPQTLTKAKPKPGVTKKLPKMGDGGGMSEEQDKDVSMADGASMISTSRGGPRRSAANKATTRLREIMPDVVNFEKEQKLSKRRRSEGGELMVSVRGEEAERGTVERSGKRRKVVEEAQEEEEEAEVEDVVMASSAKAKPRSINGKGKAKRISVGDSGDDVDEPPARTKLNGAQEKKGGRGREKELAVVRLVTTGVALSDDVIKCLTKLGVQMTTKPTDCTHLIAKGIVRTEKFLCAMSVSPYILTEEWASASAKGGKLLPERDYFLTDPTAEKKWAFKFADAMARAKAPDGGSKLFKDMTFYVTPRISVDVKLLKNVISAGGGQVQISTLPTVRILKGKANRYVLSCQEDKAIWRPLVKEGFKVYSPELVLRGALRQEIEWEKAECVIAGQELKA